jgi:hypothetical protein
VKTDIDNLRLNWRDEDGSAQFASPLRTAVAVYIVALEAENAGYKDGAQRLIESNTRLLKRAEQAEAELAALKCCGNCGNIHAYNAGTDDEFRECPYLREDDAEHDYLSIGCHYNPSRWTARAEEGGGDE